MEVNEQCRKEEERTLYNKIQYNSEIVLGKYPDRVIATLDKPNLRLKSGQDRLIVQEDIQLLDFTDSVILWKDNIHITVCDTFVVFTKKLYRNDKQIYEILPHPHPTDSTDFRTLHDFQTELSNSKLDQEKDIVYRAFVEATHTKNNTLSRSTLTIAQKVIRFSKKQQKDDFIKKIEEFKSPRLTSSSVSSATTSRGARANPRRHQRQNLRISKSHQLETAHLYVHH